MTSGWARLRLKSPASQLCTQPLIRVQIKVNIKAPRHWPLCLGIHRGPVNSPHKWPVTRKMFPFDDVIMLRLQIFAWFQISIQPSCRHTMCTSLLHNGYIAIILHIMFVVFCTAAPIHKSYISIIMHLTLMLFGTVGFYTNYSVLFYRNWDNLPVAVAFVINPGDLNISYDLLLTDHMTITKQSKGRVQCPIRYNHCCTSSLCSCDHSLGARVTKRIYQIPVFISVFAIYFNWLPTAHRIHILRMSSQRSC